MPKHSTTCGLAAVALVLTLAGTASYAQEPRGEERKSGSGGGADAVHSEGVRPGGGANDGGRRDGERHAPSPPVTGPNGSVASRSGIDLVRPDDGYGNLRRRAAAHKAPGTIVPATSGVPGVVKMNTRPVPETGAGHMGAEPPRNAVGIATGGAAEFGRHPPGALSHVPVGVPGHAGTGPANEPRSFYVGQSIQSPAINGGINGTNFGRAVTGGIGGPAKPQSGINGTALRPKH